MKHFSGGFICGLLLETLSLIPRSDFRGHRQIWQVFGGQTESPLNVFHCRVKSCSTLQPQDSNPDLISKILALNILKTFRPKQPLPYKWSSTPNTGINYNPQDQKAATETAVGFLHETLWSWRGSVQVQRWLAESWKRCKGRRLWGESVSAGPPPTPMSVFHAAHSHWISTQNIQTLYDAPHHIRYDNEPQNLVKILIFNFICSLHKHQFDQD